MPIWLKEGLVKTDEGGNILWGIGWFRLGKVRLAINTLLVKRRGGSVGTDEGQNKHWALDGSG